MQIAIVIGGSSGIGQSTAIQLAQRGTGVILTYNGNPSGAQDTVAAIARDMDGLMSLYRDLHANPELSEQEIVDLSYVIMVINAWNRINIAFRSEPGSRDKAWGLDKADLN